MATPINTGQNAGATLRQSGLQDFGRIVKADKAQEALLQLIDVADACGEEMEDMAGGGKKRRSSALKNAPELTSPSRMLGGGGAVRPLPPAQPLASGRQDNRPLENQAQDPQAQALIADIQPAIAGVQQDVEQRFNTIEIEKQHASAGQMTEGVESRVDVKTVTVKVRNETPNRTNATAEEATAPVNHGSMLTDALKAIGVLRELIHASSLQDLNDQLKILKEQMASLAEKGNSLSNGIKQAQQAADQAAAVAQGSEAALNTAQQQQNQAQDKVEKQEDKLTDAEAELGVLQQLPDDDPEKAQKIKRQQQRVEQLSGELAQAKAVLSQAQGNVAQKQQTHENNLKVASEKAQQLKTQIDQAQSYANANQGVLFQRRNGALEETVNSAMSQLSLLAGMLTEMIGKQALKSLDEEQKVLEKIQESNRESALNKAKEMEAEQQKAAEASKAASCTSKILGALAVVVAVVALVVTAGAASPLVVALAAVGLAMAVTDVVLDATGNGSIMQHMASGVASIAKDIMIAKGMSKEEAEEAANIVGMVVAGALMLGLSVASIGAGGARVASNVAKVAGNVASKAASVAAKAAKSVATVINQAAQQIGRALGSVGRVISRIINKLDLAALMKAVSKMSSGARSSLSRLGSTIKDSRAVQTFKNAAPEVTRAKAGNLIQGAETVVTTSGTIAVGTLNVQAAQANLEARKLQAALSEGMFSMEMITELQKQIVAAVKEQLENLMNMFDAMSGALTRQQTQHATMINKGFSFS